MLRIHNYPRLAALLLACLLCFVAEAGAQGRKAVFVDEGEQQPSFAAYRKTLLDSVVKRDIDTIVASAAPDIKLDFGGDEGREEFRNRLTVSAEDFSQEYAYLADENREQYWAALEEVLRLGGVFTRPDTFEAPYTWVVKLGDTDDAYSTGFVIGSAVPMRDRASKYGNVVTILDEDVVTILAGGKGTSFREVELGDGRKGFVHKDNLRSAIDYRAIFENRGGRWLMTAFIAGD